MIPSYQEYLNSKRVSAPSYGFAVDPATLHPALFPFQREIVHWALAKGRSALFEDCGLGKTLQQLSWADEVCRHTGGSVLILTPLAVAPQTCREANRFGFVGVGYCKGQEDCENLRICVTNYNRLHLFDPKQFVGVVLDESSILKNFMGKIKQQLMQAFTETPYRLCCTATPAPNDHLELGNHADFLGIMPSNEMIMRWFINDTMSAGAYRLKAHAEKDYWRWVATWAVSLSKPSDLGYSDYGFVLPPLCLSTHIVEVDNTQEAGDALFRDAQLSATTMHKEMRRTAKARAAHVATLVNAQSGPWVVWCNTDYESDELQRVLHGAVDIRGSETQEAKERKLERFADGKIQILISKPSVCGFGMNWQHCHQMAFVGLSYSYEQLYQALRRSWRFGQKEAVQAHIVLAETEGSVLQAITRKQTEHETMKKAMKQAMNEGQVADGERRTLQTEIETATAEGAGWTLRLGDCCVVTGEIESNSVGLSVFSPPFANLYIYSDHEADMGNCVDTDDFMQHFQYLIRDLHRVTTPGRLCAVHCKDLPLYKGRDGAAGLRDFPGEIVRNFEECGWTYHSRVTIWKDPVIEMQRSKNHGLLYKNFRERGENSRQGMADYLIVFRKWDGMEGTESAVPVKHSDTEQIHYAGTDVPAGFRPTKDRGEFYDYNLQVWQRYASPVWFDINQTRVLNYQLGRDNEDEKHICPLQLDVIERAIVLWSNPGDLIYSPFAGIGSEGFCAVKMGRRFVGAELKRSYFEIAARNLVSAQISQGQSSLFDELFAEEAEVGEVVA